MKKICLLALSFLVLHSVNAQVVYSEDFENFTIGDVGTDDGGRTAGQGGMACSFSNSTNGTYIV